MADGYDNERKGALFKNKNKRDGKQDPEYKGSATIAGIEYWVSSWINTSKAGEKYMSLSFQPKEARQDDAPAKTPVTAGADDDLNDEIPFAFAILAPLAGLMIAAANAANGVI